MGALRDDLKSPILDGKLRPMRGRDSFDSAQLGPELASCDGVSQTPLANKREESDQDLGSLAQVKGKAATVPGQKVRRPSLALCPCCHQPLRPPHAVCPSSVCHLGP